MNRIGSVRMICLGVVLGVVSIAMKSIDESTLRTSVSFVNCLSSVNCPVMKNMKAQVSFRTS